MTVDLIPHQGLIFCSAWDCFCKRVVNEKWKKDIGVHMCMLYECLIYLDTNICERLGTEPEKAQMEQ